jgi:hypothetical protein
MVPPTICALAPGAIKIRIERRQFGSASRKLRMDELLEVFSGKGGKRLAATTETEGAL